MAKNLGIVRELLYLFSSYHLELRGSTMLTLSHVIEDTYNVEVDYYTPLTIECSSFPSYIRKAYFRLVGDNSLLEIGINPDSFRLMNIILVQVSNVTLMDDMSIEEVEEIEGIPVFRDTFMFTNGLHDRRHSFDVFLSKDFLKIQLLNPKETMYLTNGRVKLGFSQDGPLVSILLVELASHEYEILKNSFE